MSDSALTVEARIPDSLRADVEGKLALAAQDRVGERMRAGDATLWGPPDAAEIGNRLGWLTIAQRMLGELEPIERFADQARGDGITDVVLLGMGGSSLAPEVLRRCFAPPSGWPRLHVLDTTDAAAIHAVEGSLELARTLFIVSSKSGGTIEPRSLFEHFFSRLGDGRHYIAITDPGTPLAELAQRHGFAQTFLGDPEIGGRYSALSPFGVVPGALIGVDVRGMLAGSAAAWETAILDTGATPGAGEAPAACVWLGAALSALAQAGRDKLTFLISPSLPGIGLWLEQLVAESTGKLGRGVLPVAEEPLGEPEAYGEDRVFAYLPDLGHADPEHEARIERLAHAGHPLLKIPTRGPADLGRVFLLWELAVAVAGWGLRINPFDQPNVQQAKDATQRVLADYEASGALPELTDAGEPALRSLLLEARPPEYLALMAYLSPSPAFDQAAAELRACLREATRATTTFGYGPRYLHSTGQFHKGGPRRGRFLALVHDGATDVEIPGAPYTFTTLKHAQAIGDLETLRELGRPAERVTLAGEDPTSALRALTQRLKEPT